jgi:RimJ/RimL family protein N-acetyltransferase
MNVMVSTERLILRPYKKSDYEAWKQGRITRKQASNRFDLGPKSLKESSLRIFNALLKKYQLRAKKDDLYTFGIFLKKSGEHIGQIDIMTICRRDRQHANLGYALHNRFWGQGFGTEACSAIFKLSFSKLGFHRIEAVIDPKNSRSIRLAKTLGMKKDGVKRSYVFENGKWIDQVSYVAIPKDVGLKDTPPSIGF